MLKFSEILYARPDLDDVKRQMESITESFVRAESYQEAAGFFIEMDRLKRHVRSTETVATIRHSIDTRDSFYDEEELSLRESLGRQIKVTATPKGGTLQVESTEGVGTTVTITLPSHSMER